MTAFRLPFLFPIYMDDQAVPLAGGELRFYEAGTTTPKDVYGDSALSVNNGSTVDLDSAGRPEVDIWGDGSYFVELYDADGVKVAEADDVEIPGGSAATLPASPSVGDYAQWNGSAWVGATPLEVPDPTGQTGKTLSNDGANLLWIPTPEDGAAGADADIVVGSASFRAGTAADATKFLVQTGTGTAPAVSDIRSSVGVTFPTAYARLWAVVVTPTIQNVSTSGGGATPVASVTGYTAGSASSAVTVNFRNPTDGDVIDSGDYISTPVTFAWVAFGDVEVP